MWLAPSNAKAQMFLFSWEYQMEVKKREKELTSPEKKKINNFEHETMLKSSLGIYCIQKISSSPADFNKMLHISAMFV